MLFIVKMPLTLKAFGISLMDRKWICYWLEFCVLSAGPIQAKWHFNMDSRHEHWALTLFIRFHVHDWFLYWLLRSISWWTLKMSTSTCSCKWMKTIELFKFIVCGYRCNDAWNSRAFSVWRTWSWWYNTHFWHYLHYITLKKAFPYNSFYSDL